MQAAINTYAYVTARIDTFRRMVETQSLNSIPAGSWYYYGRFGTRYFHIPFQDATIEQLKSSGALRYLGDTSIIRKILSYEESIRVIYMLQNKYEPEKTENWNLVQKVFDQSFFNILDSIATRDSTAMHFEMRDQRLFEFLNTDFSLYTYDKNVLRELKNWAYNSSRNYKVIINDIATAKEKAQRIIDALKKEYHLK